MKLISVLSIIFIFSFSTQAESSDGLNQLDLQQVLEIVYGDAESSNSRSLFRRDSELIRNNEVRDGESQLKGIAFSRSIAERVSFNGVVSKVMFDARYLKEFTPDEAHEDEQPGSYYYACQGQITLESDFITGVFGMEWGVDDNGGIKELCSMLPSDPTSGVEIIFDLLAM